MDILITAGAVPRPDEPLYASTHGGYKAMLELAGKPMIQWILDTLNACPQVDRIIVAGLPEITALDCNKPLWIVENQHSCQENILAGVQKIRSMNPQVEKALLISSDIPSITPEMVAWMIDLVQETDHDIYYPIINREDLLRRFPSAHLNTTRLKDMSVVGGSMIGFRTSIVSPLHPAWGKIAASSGSPMRQAALVGYDTMFLMLLSQLSVSEAESMISRKLDLKLRLIQSPYAEIAMDVDKPNQYEILKNDLEKRVLQEMGV